MVRGMIQIKTPDAPATNRQMWLLHLLTGEDTRNLDLTMKQASDRIAELKNTKPLTTPNNRPKSQPSPSDRQYHYYLMVKPKRKWLSYHRTTHLKTIKQELNNPYYSIEGWYIVKARAVWCARQMLDRGISELVINGKLYAKLIEQGG